MSLEEFNELSNDSKIKKSNNTHITMKDIYEKFGCNVIIDDYKETRNEN